MLLKIRYLHVEGRVTLQQRLILLWGNPQGTSILRSGWRESPDQLLFPDGSFAEGSCCCDKRKVLMKLACILAEELNLMVFAEIIADSTKK